MNRREMLLSSMSVPATSQVVMSDNPGSVVCFLSPGEDITPEQAKKWRKQLDIEEKRTGYKFVIIPPGTEVQAASGAKFGKSESVGVCSMSAFAESEESLMRIWNDKDV